MLACATRRGLSVMSPFAPVKRFAYTGTVRMSVAHGISQTHDHPSLITTPAPRPTPSMRWSMSAT